MFPQVMKKAHVARQRLLRLGIFKEVEVLIDTSEGTGELRSLAAGSWSVEGRLIADVCVASSSGSDALPNGLDVTFEVTEIKRLTGSYNTMVGNNEGSMVRRATPSTLHPAEGCWMLSPPGAGTQAAQHAGPRWETHLPVLLRDQGDVLWAVLLQASAWIFWTQVCR